MFGFAARPALEQEEQLGPLVMVVPVATMPLESKHHLSADVHGFFESALYPKVSGYLKPSSSTKGKG